MNKATQSDLFYIKAIFYYLAVYVRSNIISHYQNISRRFEPHQQKLDFLIQINSCQTGSIPNTSTSAFFTFAKFGINAMK